MSQAQQLSPIYRQWFEGLSEALELDNWGQVDEAEQKYQYVQQQVKKEVDKKQITNTSQTNIAKLLKTVETRIQEINKYQDKGVGTQGIKTVVEAFPKIVGKNTEDFPLKSITLSEAQLQSLQSKKEDQVQAHKKEDFPDILQTYLTLQIHKWGFKNTSIYYEPTVVISVVNQRGQLLEKQQQTSISQVRDVSYVHFNESISLKTPLETLEQGSAIFFEFKHYKTGKRKHSIKCYTYMEFDEIKVGTLALESYKKPAEYSRIKKPKLFTIKDLFFYVTIQMSKETRDPM
eukprot:TRINITY_DN6600_c0_g3_i1.p1 TRINITY_DN6600_c0_g3~~TRINITY_DN6600_c0_g3_i1.p1  ORF type:complete len:289 (+),score=27.40 TRINITY_DN6600_c0_g3_i1:63-929(+)